jgi:very-short-patch-repair endonuclease
VTGCVIKPRNIYHYNPKLKERARHLRNNSTLSEVLLWNELKNGKMKGKDFHRQKPIINFIADFFCPELKLVIEIDGNSHDKENAYDKDRER